jgi:hypothetical protein
VRDPRYTVLYLGTFTVLCCNEILNEILPVGYLGYLLLPEPGRISFFFDARELRAHSAPWNISESSRFSLLWLDVTCCAVLYTYSTEKCTMLLLRASLSSWLVHLQGRVLARVARWTHALGRAPFFVSCSCRSFFKLHLQYH